MDIGEFRVPQISFRSHLLLYARVIHNGSPDEISCFRHTNFSGDLEMMTMDDIE